MDSYFSYLQGDIAELVITNNPDSAEDHCPVGEVRNRMDNGYKYWRNMVLLLLGQLPTVDNSAPDRNKAHLLPTRTTIPRTTPN